MLHLNKGLKSASECNLEPIFSLVSDPINILLKRWSTSQEKCSKKCLVELTCTWNLWQCWALCCGKVLSKFERKFQGKSHCHEHFWNSYRWISLTFAQNLRIVTIYKWFNHDIDPDHRLDPIRPLRPINVRNISK